MTSEAELRLRLASPDDADAVFAAGAKAVKAGLAAEALPLLERTLERHPGDARIWQVIGLAQRQLEDLGPAVAAFEKAAELAPGDPLIAHSLARSTLEAGLPAAALFERALALAPTDAAVLLGQSAALLAEGQIGEAIDRLAALLVQHPAWLPGHATLCRLRWLAGERESFTSSFEAAVAAAPREVEIWREWADTLMHAGRYEAALAVVAGGRTAAGQHPMFDALETVAASVGSPGTELEFAL